MQAASRFSLNLNSDAKTNDRRPNYQITNHQPPTTNHLPIQPVARLHHEDVRGVRAEGATQVAEGTELAGPRRVGLRQVPHEEERAAADVFPSHDDVAAQRL